MSRVDEALRRAAEDARESGGTGPDTVPLGVTRGDVDALAGEPFPIEIAVRARHREGAASAAKTHAPAATAVIDTSHVAPPPGRPDVSRLEQIDERVAGKMVTSREMTPGSREQYRRLAAVLHDAQGNSGLQVVMLASAVPGEGKTLTAANLALTLSESYRRRVLLIDADLRKPALHHVFKTNTTSGLSEGLESDGGAKLVVRQVTAKLSVLPAGRPNSDPMAGLTSERMRRLIAEAKETFDWVILDTPPLMVLPDAHLLASMVDAVLLVVRADSTPHALVKRAADAIGHKRILGVVLNQAHSSPLGYGAHYHDEYLNEPEDPERP